MGRGKKKDKKSDAAPDGKSEEPSTSQTGASEEDAGLTGGKKKVESNPVEIATTEGEGLTGSGLTGGGKSRSKKKPKKDVTTAATEKPTQASTVSSVSQPAPPSWKQETTAASGHDRGRGRVAFQETPSLPPAFGPAGPKPAYLTPGIHPGHQVPGPPGAQTAPAPPFQAPISEIRNLQLSTGRGRGRGRGGGEGRSGETVWPAGTQPGYQMPGQPGAQPGYQMPGQPGAHPLHQMPGPPAAHQAYPPSMTAPVTTRPHSGLQQHTAPGPSSAAVPRSASQQAPFIQPAPMKSESTVALKSTMSGLRIPVKVWPPSNRPVGVPHKVIKVLTNYLQMTLTAKKVYRYDVSFKPDKPKKLIPNAFLNMVAALKLPKDNMAFDQVKNCYTLRPLPNVPENDRFTTNVDVIDNNGKKLHFEITIKLTGIVDTQSILDYMKNKSSSLNPPAEAISCIDVILRQGTLEKYVKVGRQFFRRPVNPIDLTGGLEMWTGLFQSAIFTSSAFINIDLAHKGFPREQPLVNALVNDFRLASNQTVERQRGRGVQQFQDFIKNLRVIATIGGDTTAKGQKREFICNGLVDAPVNIKFTVTDDSGRKKSMTVADYFREKGVRLQYPNLNCVWVGPRDKTIYYPMELLSVSYGQRSNKLLNEMQLSTMVKTAAAPPNERKQKIDEVKKAMNYSQNDFFKKFGLNIANEFFEVGARILKPPTLDVGNRQTMMPRDGVWQANGLLKPEALQSWGFIALECDQRSCIDIDGIIQMIQKTGRQMGMEVTNPSPCLPTAKLKDLSSILFKCLEQGVKFLFIIVGTWGQDTYQRVKQMAELDVGILTQCIKENTATRRMNIQTVKNILLKVNSKLMGINQALNSASKPLCLRGGAVMVVGADVTHPSPDQPNVPSIAAVTASMDPDCYKYNIELSVQTPKREMIMDFEEMMLDHLKIYKQKMQYLPKKIFYFRDGVSEGQFAQVMDSEIPAMHRAYQRLSGGPKPEILFLLVQKRHHTRFFTGERDCRNVEPGTVVDEHIVHASELDFYLVSHKAIKGTARPTRYHAVCNDGNIPFDEVEQLTYYLCHLYSRCMRAVSYPTPTYYAHLACLRAKTLTYGKQFNNRDLERTPVRLRVLDKMLEFSRMFFV